MSTNIWTFQYAPQTFNDLVLCDEMREVLKPMLKTLPNIFLAGHAGVGKGSFVSVFLKETGCDFLKINGSDENSIDTFREKIKSFGTSLGITPIKYVVLNEAERLSQAALDALLDFSESVQSITRFIFIVNSKEKFKPEHLSRYQKIDFIPAAAGDIAKHCLKILKAEKVEVNKPGLIDIVKKCYPDIRDTINTLQLNCIDGKMKENISFFDDVYKEMLEFIIKQDIDSIRTMLRSKSIDYPYLYKYIFDNVEKFKSPGDVIIEIGERLYRDSSVAIKEINFVAGILSLIKKGAI